MHEFLNVFSIIIKESIKILPIIFGDLLYLLFMIIVIYAISNIINKVFLIKVKKIINPTLDNNIISKKNYTSNLIEYLKREEDSELYKTTLGKVIDLAKMFNIFFALYMLTKFNMDLFIIYALLNLFSWISVQLHLNQRVLNRINDNNFKEDEILANFFFNKSTRKKNDTFFNRKPLFLDEMEYFDFLNLFTENIKEVSILRYKMSKLVLSKKLNKEIIQDILNHEKLTEDIILNINRNYSEQFN